MREARSRTLFAENIRGLVLRIDPLSERRRERCGMVLERKNDPFNH